MNSETEDIWIKNFEIEIFNRVDTIDPSRSEDWHSLALGFFIGRGLTIKESHALAVKVSYTYQKESDED